MDQYCPSDPDTIGGPSIAICVLTTLAYSLRLASRTMSKAGVWWDDYLLLPASVHAPKTDDYRLLNFVKILLILMCIKTSGRAPSVNHDVNNAQDFLR